MSPPHDPWHLEGDSVATLRQGPLEAFVDCDPDGTDVVPKRWKGRAIENMYVLGTGHSSELKLHELFARGSDLIANFAPGGEHRVSPQIYWRTGWEAASNAIRLELVISVRTELLDSAPESTVRSYSGNASLFHTDRLSTVAFRDVSDSRRTWLRSESAEQLFVFRHTHHDFSYAQMVHPSDFVSAEADGQAPQCVRTQLFPDRLEKGVIRRARVCGWFLPAQNDLEVAVELARAFIDEPLPLTA